MARLRELALVSRSWLPLCRAVIFSQYSLWDMKVSSLRAPQFLYMLTHPLLAVYVTHVRIIPRIFDDFTRRVSSMVPSVFPRTTILTMDHDGRGDITSGLLCGLLRELSELRELHLPLIYGKDSFLETPTFPHMPNLHSLTVSAVAYNMIQILDAIASSSKYNSSQLRTGVFSMFYHSQIPQPHEVPEFHQALEGIRGWEDLQIKYPSRMMSAESHIHPGTERCMTFDAQFSRLCRLRYHSWSSQRLVAPAYSHGHRHLWIWAARARSSQDSLRCRPTGAPIPRNRIGVRIWPSTPEERSSYHRDWVR
jgi:hypothetical protein